MQNAAKQFLEQSEAYDLYNYRKRQETQETPKLVVSKRTGMKLLSRIRLMMCLVMFISVLSLSLYHNVAVVELGDRISIQSANLYVLEEEGEIMQSQLDNAMSLSAVAEVTQNKMLMGEAENYQITYINLNDGDTVEKAPKAGKISLWENITQTLIKLQEYMNQS